MKNSRQNPSPRPPSPPPPANKKAKMTSNTQQIGRAVKTWRKTSGDKFSIVLLFFFTCRLWSVDKAILGTWSGCRQSKLQEASKASREKLVFLGKEASILQCGRHCHDFFFLSVLSLLLPRAGLYTLKWICAGGYNSERIPFFFPEQQN